MSAIGSAGVKGLGANTANENDASLWCWFCMFYEQGRIRWLRSAHGWAISVDHKHLSTERDFDMAIRAARERFFSGNRAKVN